MNSARDIPNQVELYTIVLLSTSNNEFFKSIITHGLMDCKHTQQFEFILMRLPYLNVIIGGQRQHSSLREGYIAHVIRRV